MNASPIGKPKFIQWSPHREPGLPYSRVPCRSLSCPFWTFGNFEARWVKSGLTEGPLIIAALASQWMILLGVLRDDAGPTIRRCRLGHGITPIARSPEGIGFWIRHSAFAGGLSAIRGTPRNTFFILILGLSKRSGNQADRQSGVWPGHWTLDQAIERCAQLIRLFVKLGFAEQI